MAIPVKRQLLLDSASLYFRAFYAIPESITAPDGTPINAVRGFLDMVSHLLVTHRPRGLLACWDQDWRPEFRVAALPSYKAQRVAESTGAEQVPESLSAQVPIIAAVLQAAGLGPVGHPGFEADDVLATLATRFSQRGLAVDVVTGDRDLFQVVDDTQQVRVLYVGKSGVRSPDVVDQAFLAEKYGVPDGQGYADLAILRGDPSDGLPGVPGIGVITAARILQRYRNLPGVLHALDQRDSGLTPAQLGRLTAARGYLMAAPTVVHTVREVPVAEQPQELPSAPVDAERLSQLAAHWGLESPLNRLSSALGWVGSE